MRHQLTRTVSENAGIIGVELSRSFEAVQIKKSILNDLYNLENHRMLF